MSEKYAFIEAENATVAGDTACAPSITQMCGWLRSIAVRILRMEVPPGQRGREKEERAQAADREGIRGFRRHIRLPARVALQLARWGVQAGLELVRALMRELGLVACQPRPWRPVNHAAGPGGADPRSGCP